MRSLTSLLGLPLQAFQALNYSYHYEKPASVQAPYMVWQEQAESSFHSNNSKSERALEGVCEFYTQTESDPKLDEIENALEGMGASWQLTSVQFESESELIHFSWDWSVT